jgi:hypothetical protein
MFQNDTLASKQELRKNLEKMENKGDSRLFHLLAV